MRREITHSAWVVDSDSSFDGNASEMSSELTSLSLMFSLLSSARVFPKLGPVGMSVISLELNLELIAPMISSAEDNKGVWRGLVPWELREVGTDESWSGDSNKRGTGLRLTETILWAGLPVTALVGLGDKAVRGEATADEFCDEPLFIKRWRKTDYMISNYIM